MENINYYNKARRKIELFDGKIIPRVHCNQLY